jgi:hypothetical protein
MEWVQDVFMAIAALVTEGLFKLGELSKSQKPRAFA